MIKRTSLGLLATILIAAAFDFVPTFVPEAWVHERLAGYFYIWPGVEGACVGFLATLGGAYVARIPFVIPAVLFAIVTWLLMIYLLNSIAAVVGQGDILAVAGSNVLGLLFGMVGAAAGAYLGGRLSTHDQEGIADAAEHRTAPTHEGGLTTCIERAWQTVGAHL